MLCYNQSSNQINVYSNKKCCISDIFYYFCLYPLTLLVACFPKYMIYANQDIAAAKDAWMDTSNVLHFAVWAPSTLACSLTWPFVFSKFHVTTHINVKNHLLLLLFFGYCRSYGISVLSHTSLDVSYLKKISIHNMWHTPV